MNRIFKIAALTFVTIALPTASYATEVKTFLEDLDGQFRGAGLVVMGSAESQQRVACSVKNSFSEGDLALEVTGKCATAQGKVNIAGELELTNEDTIVGSFISAARNMEVTKSSSTFANGELVLSMYQRDKVTGDLNRTRQVVSMNDDGGFRSVFYTYDRASGAYLETGNVNFVPK